MLDATLLLALNRLVGAAGDSDPALEPTLVIVAEFDRKLLSSGAISTFRAATHEWATSPADTPANTPYIARLRVPKMAQSVLDADWKRAGGASVTEIELLNIDGALDADFNAAAWGWHGAPVRLRAGLRTWTLTQFKPLPTGDILVLGVLRGDETVKVIVQADADRLDAPLQGRPGRDGAGRYGGFAHAYDFAGTANCTYDNNGNLGLRSATIHRRFKIGSNPASSAVIIAKRDTLATAAGTVGWVVFVNTTGDLRVILDDGTNAVAATIGTSGQFVDGKWHALDIAINRVAATLQGYVDGAAIGSATSIAAITGSLSNTQPLRDGRLSTTASNFWTGQLDEARLWRVALTADQVKSRYQMAASGVEPGLVMYNPYDDNTGTTNASLLRGPEYVQPVLSAGPTCSMGSTVANPASGSFTLVAWNRIPAGGTGALAGRKNANAAANAGYVIQSVSAGEWRASVSDGTTQVAAILGTGLDDDTEWGFALVVDRTANELRGYRLDHPRGTLIAATPISIAGLGSFGPAGINFMVAGFSGGTGLLTGSPSWVGFTSEALTATAVKLALSEQWVEFDDVLPSAPPVLSTLASNPHFWPLDETSGTTATDRVPAGANGTWSSAPTRRTKAGTITAGASGVWIGTLEGGRNLRGLAKPVALGRPLRFKPVLIDDARKIWQYSDPSLGGTVAVDEVLDAGELLTLTTHYTVSLTDSTITVVPARTVVGDLQVSVKGIKDDAGVKWIYFPGDLIDAVWRRLLGLVAAGIDAPSIAAYNVAHPAVQGLWLGPCDDTLQCVYDKMLSPDGYAFRNLAGKMALGTRTLPAGAPVLVLDDTSIAIAEPVTGPPPTWLARVSYGETLTRIGFYSSAAGLAQRQLSSQTEQYVEDRRVSVRDAHPDALERTYDTATVKMPDAALLVPRMLDLDGADRPPWRLVLAKNHWSLDLGEELEVASYSRYDLAGKRYRVVGMEYGLDEGMPTSVLIVWGGVPI